MSECKHAVRRSIRGYLDGVFCFWCWMCKKFIRESDNKTV